MGFIVRGSVLYCFLLFLTSASSNEIRLTEGSNEREGYLEIKVKNQWVTVCAGNKALTQAACKWGGYVTGREVRRKSTLQENRSSWSFNVTCPDAARDFSTCTVGRCGERRRLYVECSGYPHCRMEDGTLIPGNSSVFVGNDKVNIINR